MLIYARFGNYIGEPEGSEVEDEQVADKAQQYLDDNEEEDVAAAANDQQLMEVDGMSQSSSVARSGC